MLTRTCLLFVLLIFAGTQAFAQQQTPDLSSADPYAAGMAAFHEKDYSEAEPLLRQAYATRQDDTQLLLNLALCQSALNECDKAEQSYQTLSKLLPNDPRVKFELGRTLAACGKTAQAREIFLYLKKNNPPPELHDNVTTMLDRLDGREKKTTFSGGIELSFLHDTNVNAGPNCGTLGTVLLDPDTMPKSTTGAGYAAMLNVDHKLGTRGLWKVSGGISRNEIRYSKHRDNNVAVTTISAKLNRKLQHGSAQFGLSYTDIEQGEMDSINTFGSTGLWMLSLAEDKQLTSDVGVEFRDNQKDSGADSTYYTVGEYLRWFFGAQNHHNIQGGVRLFKENAKAPKNSNRGYEFKIAPSFSLGWQSRLDLGATWGNTYYNAPPAATTKEDRHDEKSTLSAALSRPLWNKNTKATVSFVHTKNHSNYIPNDYHKNATKFSLSYSF